jgi:hypothetical protein
MIPYDEVQRLAAFCDDIEGRLSALRGALDADEIAHLDNAISHTERLRRLRLAAYACVKFDAS